MTKIYAFSRVHYGIDYLRQVIQSTMPFVREHLILYTPTPTFGRYTSMPNPDSREAVFNAAFSVKGARVRWMEHVPVQVETALNTYPDADLILELDADEIIQPALFEHMIRRYELGELNNFAYRVPFLHHWRSFGYVCEDSGHPIRLYVPKAANRETSYYPSGNGYIHHFGYARRTLDMQYKWETSMHIGELRPEWWGDIWGKFPDRLTDVHPVCRDHFWDARPYDRAKLPEYMREHPYYGLEVIE